MSKYDRDDLFFRQEVTGSYAGQVDCSLDAYIGDLRVASLTYSVFRDAPMINMIEVLPDYRRKGIATLMIEEIQAIYPNEEIDFGMFASHEGARLIESLSFYEVPNKEYEEAIEKLERARKERDAIIQSIEEMRSDPDRYNDRELASGSFDRLNELYDIIDHLSEHADGLKACSRFVIPRTRSMPDNSEMSSIDSAAQPNIRGEP